MPRDFVTAGGWFLKVAGYRFDLSGQNSQTNSDCMI